MQIGPTALRGGRRARRARSRGGTPGTAPGPRRVRAPPPAPGTWGTTKSSGPQGRALNRLSGLLSLDPGYTVSSPLALQRDALTVQASRQDHPAEQVAQAIGRRADVGVAGRRAVGREQAERLRAGPVRGRLVPGRPRLKLLATDAERIGDGPAARLPAMVPSAYLRVFQPLDAFDAEEQAHWERYLLQGARSPRSVPGTGTASRATASVVIMPAATASTPTFASWRGGRREPPGACGCVCWPG